MLGSNTLWEEGCLAELLISIAGDIFIVGSVDGLRWGKKTLSRTLFPWLLAEDNPVISC